MKEELFGEDSALIVVDVQKDFLENGALPVPNGSQVIPVINRLIPKFRSVIYSRDLHPEGHVSFASSHPGMKPFEKADLSYGTQVLWPDHCVRGTTGSEFASGLIVVPGAVQVEKGGSREVDSYSAFLEADRKTSTGLSAEMKARGIRMAYFCGLALDFCVSWSALDAAAEGFESLIITDACRAINADGSEAAARRQWKEGGVREITSSELLALGRRG